MSRIAPVEFEAFKTIEPDSKHVKDTKFEVEYTAQEKFTVVLCLKTKLENAWSNNDTFSEVIDEDQLKYTRQSTMLLQDSIK